MSAVRSWMVAHSAITSTSYLTLKQTRSALTSPTAGDSMLTFLRRRSLDWPNWKDCPFRRR